MKPARRTAPDRIDPWAVVRAAHPGQMLVRVINADANAQAFVRVDKARANAKGLDVYDGATVFTPARAAGYSRDEQAALIAAADQVWQPDGAAPH